MKKITVLLLCLVLIIGAFSACESRDTAPETTPTVSSTEATKPKIPSVRYLNFQPELEESWNDLAAAYTANTGVPVTVITESPENWRQTLDTSLSGEDAPTLFQLVQPTADDAWQPLCCDLSHSDAYAQLANAGLALTKGENPLALPCHLESSGIWVNKTLLAQAGYSLNDLTSQQVLKTISEAVTVDSEVLGFSAFPTSTSDAHMDLAAAAIAWEFQQEELTETANFRGTALDGLRSLLDTMLQNSTDASGTAAFLEGKALFCPGTSADWGALSAVFTEDELALIPAFLTIPEEPDPEEENTPEATDPTVETTAEEEPQQGLCVGAAYFWCVNPDAPEQDLTATLDFLDWCLGTDEGAAALAELGYALPYLTAPEHRNPFLPAPDAEDCLLRQDWAMPSRQWKDALQEALDDYAADPTDSSWDRVSEVFADYWAAEYALTDPAEETGDA